MNYHEQESDQTYKGFRGSYVTNNGGKHNPVNLSDIGRAWANGIIEKLNQ